MSKINNTINMKSKFFFFAAMAMIIATGCAKTFGGSNDPAHGDKDEIRFSSYVNVLTKSGTKATETFDNGEGFVVVGGYEAKLGGDYFSNPVSSALAAANTFNATQVYNGGTSESPVWVPKEIPSAVLDVAFEQFISQELISRDRLNAIVADCYNSNFKASWLLASMLLIDNRSSAAFDCLKTMSWSPVHKYWNYNTDKLYQFYAISPATIINDAALVGVWDLFGPSVESVRDLYMDGKLDIMSAYATVTKGHFGEDVDLVFSHLGSKLEFNIKNACAGEIKIHAAAFGRSISKSAKFVNNKLNPTTPAEDEMKYHFYIPYITEDMADAMERQYPLESGYIKNSGFDVSDEPHTLAANDLMSDSYVVCPQDIDIDSNIVMLAYTMDDNTNMYMAQVPLSSFLFNEEPLSRWQSGKKYTYNINIKHDEIKFDVSITDWVDGGESTLNVAGV